MDFLKWTPGDQGDHVVLFKEQLLISTEFEDDEDGACKGMFSKSTAAVTSMMKKATGSVMDPEHFKKTKKVTSDMMQGLKTK